MDGYGTVYPMYQAVYTSSRVNIYCYSITLPKWRKNGRRYRSNVKGNGLLFPQVKEEDIGVYTCMGTKDSVGQPFSAHSQLYVGGNIIILGVISKNTCH